MKMYCTISSFPLFNWQLSRGTGAAVAVGQSPTACDREETRVRSMGSALPAQWLTDPTGLCPPPTGTYCLLALLWPGRWTDSYLNTYGGGEAKANMTNLSQRIPIVKFKTRWFDAWPGLCSSVLIQLIYCIVIQQFFNAVKLTNVQNQKTRQRYR